MNILDPLRFFTFLWEIKENLYILVLYTLVKDYHAYDGVDGVLITNSLHRLQM